MCGIAGFFLNDPRHADIERLRKMTDSVTHRGPDDNGLLLEAEIGLGHRRLSILDLTKAGRQPMVSDDGRVAISFNGEIYNFQELRSELERAGHRFRTRTDTEVILNGYVQWGDAVFERLNGMFAVAVLDKAKRRLVLARDRFGVKPLYYAVNRHGLLFGSEIKVLLASGLVDREADTAAVAEYLHFSSPLGSRTFFASIRQLEPGMALSFTGEECRQFAFASIIPSAVSRDGIGLASEKTRSLLEQAVRRQMVADVPVGVFLSGGLDSSAVSTFASQHSETVLSTYSADFEFANAESELALAFLVAQGIGSNHHELRIAPTELADTVETMVKAHDQPFGDAADLPIYLMCRALGSGPKVILQGDGGDELFAGYARYLRISQGTWFSMARLALQPLNWVLPKASRAHRALRSVNAIARRKHDDWMALLMSQTAFGDRPQTVLSEGYRARIADVDPFARYREMFHRYRNLDPVQMMLYTDASVILPDIYFQKVDRASMRSSIEVRVPMMDNELAAYAMSLSAPVKLHGGQTKAVLRQAIKGLIPDEVLSAPKKGFSVPVGRWLSGPLFQFAMDILDSDVVRSSDIFDLPEIRRRLLAQRDGKADHGQLLYKTLLLAIWYGGYRPQSL